MNACRKQIETGLKELALKMAGALHKRHEGNFEQYEELMKQGWFDMIPVLLRNWKESGDSLLSIGIERIAAENLRPASQYPCLAYVYSAYRHGAKNDTSTDRLISIAPPPSGFEPSFDNPKRGYIFTAELPALTHEDICNPEKLEKYFTDPLVTLLDWYEANESTILKSLGVSGGKKSRP